MTEPESSNNLAPIFIVGSGRSGTTLLLNVFANHSQVYAPRIETRFIVEYGGLIDLVDSLTTQYSPARSREALYRFERLMRVDFVTPRARPFYGMNLDYWFGENYWKSLNNYCDSLVLYEFYGIDHPIPEYDSYLIRTARYIDNFWKRLHGKWLPRPGDVPRQIIREPKYFSNRSELISLTRKYLDSLFNASMKLSNKVIWCEKTPHHLFHINFLQELYPEARFVHAIRDPRDVARSLVTQIWASSKPTDAARMLDAMYCSWNDRKEVLNLTKDNYMEIRYEKLVSSPQDVLDELQVFCGLTDSFDTSIVKSQETFEVKRPAFSDEENQQVEEILRPHIKQFGYQ